MVYVEDEDAESETKPIEEDTESEARFTDEEDGEKGALTTHVATEECVGKKNVA